MTTAPDPRALDAFLHEHLFDSSSAGTCCWIDFARHPWPGSARLPAHEFEPIAYSTSYEGMGAVLEAMRGLGWSVVIEDEGSDWRVVFESAQARPALADRTSLPMAAALAAWAALQSDQSK